MKKTDDQQGEPYGGKSKEAEGWPGSAGALGFKPLPTGHHKCSGAPWLNLWENNWQDWAAGDQITTLPVLLSVNWSYRNTYKHKHMFIYIYKCIHIHIYTYLYIYIFLYSVWFQYIFLKHKQGDSSSGSSNTTTLHCHHCCRSVWAAATARHCLNLF